MATIKDVAKAAGVSAGSVSHYLNKEVPVSSAKAARIQQAIEALGYRVDHSARSLRRRKTQSVGIIIPDISNPFYAELAQVLEHRLWEAGLQMLLCDSAHDAKRERSHFFNLLYRRVDGIVVIYEGEASDLPRLAAETSTPVVFLDRPVEGLLSVATDNYQGGMLAARHLLSLGHTRIGALVGDGEIANVRSRMAGFMAALEEALTPLAHTLYGYQNLALGERALEFMRLPEPPTAIFTTNDIVAVGAWRTLLSHGFRIPEDISIIGFDNIQMGQWLLPPLSTISQDISALGAHAAELLLNPPSPEAPARGAVIPPRLLHRGSTAAPKERSAM